MEAEVVRMCCTIFGGTEKTCGTVSLYCDSRRAVEARIFLLVDLQEFFFRFRVGVGGGMKKIN